MSAFLSHLRTEDLEERAYRVRLLEPFVFRYDWSKGRELITIPAGFVTDFASVPRILQNIYPPTGSYRFAAIVHDWLYVQGGRSRAEADAVLKDGMLTPYGPAQIVPRGREREPVYWGVRVGGWKPWNAYRAAEAATV